MSSVTQSATTPQTLNSAVLSSPDLNPMTLGWVVKRIALYIAILVVAFGSIAWLTHASIDADARRPAAPETANAQ
ncbi:MAG: hypothetical protein ABL894_05100 [Hyphomicrobium sp.]